MTAKNINTWLGSHIEVQEHLSLTLLKRIGAALSEPVPGKGEPLPHLWQWCFFQDCLNLDELGSDGHPARGGFLPPADNRNRMWAGGRLEFITPLLADALATRTSTISAIEEKIGATGSLLFVTVTHEYRQGGELCIREEQDIVYREPSPPKLSSSEPMGQGEWNREVTPSAVQLFRYSAVTFNGHRIHYDFPYVTETEGYPGLVVHGPLIATLSLRAFEQANPGAVVSHMAFRGVRPLICPEPFELRGRITAPGEAQLQVGSAAGVAQKATVRFDATSAEG